MPRRRFKPKDPNKPPDMREWWVYVIQSLVPRYSKSGKRLEGVFYVGCTVDVLRRLQEHNGFHPSGNPGCNRGSVYTSQHRPWELRAVFGNYIGQSDAQKAERALKHGKRGVARTQWTPKDSVWCRGLGTADPRVAQAATKKPSGPETER